MVPQEPRLQEDSGCGDSAGEEEYDASAGRPNAAYTPPEEAT
jgi:hypothetical protein